MPPSPVALAQRLLILTLAIEQSSDEDLTALISERESALDELAGIEMTGETASIWTQIAAAEERALRRLEARRTTLAASIGQAGAGRRVARKYARATGETPRQVA